MKRPAASAMKKPSKGQAKPAAAVGLSSTSEGDEYAQVPFPERYLGLMNSQAFWVKSLLIIPHPREACEEAPHGWLRDWDFLTIEQRVFVLHNPESGIFPFAEGIVRFANPDAAIALPDGSIKLTMRWRYEWIKKIHVALGIKEVLYSEFPRFFWLKFVAGNEVPTWPVDWMLSYLQRKRWLELCC